MSGSDGRCAACFEPHTIAGPCARCGHQDGAPSHPRVLALGARLNGGQFRLGRALGAGGFGITYLAWDDTFNIRVAIKEFYPRELATRDTAGDGRLFVESDDQTVFAHGLKRFLDEARRVAQFRDQPNIVRVRHFFEENGTGYLVMDYYEGQTLLQHAIGPDRRLRPIPEREAIDLMLPVLDGLQEVHEHDLLHRDIKPDNIYLARRRDAIVPVLLDFGAAREYVHAKSKSSIRTVGFAPWEQYYEKGPQGPWTDVYACAATLYVLTTTKVPPDGLERRQDADELVAPDAIVPTLSRPFCHAIMRGLSVDPKARPQSASAFGGLLREALAPERVPLPAVPAQSPMPAPAPTLWTPVTSTPPEPVPPRPRVPDPGAPVHPAPQEPRRWSQPLRAPWLIALAGVGVLAFIRAFTRNAPIGSPASTPAAWFEAAAAAAFAFMGFAAAQRGLTLRGYVATAIGLALGALADGIADFAYFPVFTVFGLLPTLASDAHPASDGPSAARTPPSAAEGSVLDEYLEVTVGPEQLARADWIKVQRKDGRILSVHLAPFMQDRQRVRLKGQASNGQGHLYLILHVTEA